MQIAQAKNSVLSEELKIQNEMKREARQQDKEHERLIRQIHVLQNDTTTAKTRLLQMQRRILELEGNAGLPQNKFIVKWLQVALKIKLNCKVIFKFSCVWV